MVAIDNRKTIKIKLGVFILFAERCFGKCWLC